MSLDTQLSRTLGLCWGMLPPGSEGWDVGSFGAAQWGQMGFHRAGKYKLPIWAMPAPHASLQPGHTGWLFLTLAAWPLCLLVGGTISLAEMAVDNLAALALSTPVEPGWAPLGSMDLLWGSEAGGLKQAVCVYLCVCVSSGHVMLFHFMPGCARTSLSRASFCWSLGGTGHCAAVSPSCSCCAVGALHSPVPCLKTGQGTRALTGL